VGNGKYFNPIRDELLQKRNFLKKEEGKKTEVLGKERDSARSKKIIVLIVREGGGTFTGRIALWGKEYGGAPSSRSGRDAPPLPR